MLTRVHSVTTNGLAPVAVTIEVNSTSGIPQIIIIGLVNTAIREAKDRILAALKNIGIRLKARRTIVSLVPADIKKSGSAFDFAIAVGLISLYHQLEISLASSVFIGEVSLDGTIVPITRIVSLVTSAQKLGYKTAFIPHANLKDVKLVEGIKICGVKNLREIIDAPHKLNYASPYSIEEPHQTISSDLGVVGQLEVIRALTIAIAGKHNLHLVGPPGVGKSTIPQLAQALMPYLAKHEVLEVMQIRELSENTHSIENVWVPPFIAPHHTSSLQKMLGFPGQNKPGALTLAHKGILFLDELPEFNNSVLQGLRIPIDQKKVLLSHQGKVLEFPCNALIIAASNPCQCGFWQTGVRSCICSGATRNSYNKKLSGPLMERFDLSVHMSSLEPTAYQHYKKVHLEEIFPKIVQARKIQAVRYQDNTRYNADLTLKAINTLCSFETETKSYIEKATATLNLSTRGYEKLVAVAQTIADLEASPSITIHHCAEALNYRFEHSWPHQ